MPAAACPTRVSAADDDATLLAWLGSHDEFCPACRYDLRGLTVTTCPECNSRLSLSVSSPDVRLGPWLLAVISFALGLGFDAVVCILMATGLSIAILRGSLGSGPPLTFYVLPGSLLVLGIACFAGVVLLVHRRHRWLRLAPRTQWSVALAIFVAVGAVHLVAGLTFVLLN